MKDLFKKHWISLLGALFIFLAFSYLFKYAVDMNIVSNQMKIGLGILAGSGFAICGIIMQQTGRKIIDEIMTGLGIALLYTTISFAGVFFDMWSAVTVLLAMIAITIAATIYSFRLNFRVLMNTALLGSLVAPFVMKPEADHVFTLFLYLLVINSAYFTMSVVKRWSELRLVSFIGTWIIYTVYYLHYQPDTWATPLRYAVCAFVFYATGFIVSSWRENLKFDGLNLYLGITNGVVFSLWSFIILAETDISFSMVLVLMGAVYLASSIAVYAMSGRFTVPVFTKFYAGLLLMLISGIEAGKGSHDQPLMLVYIWTISAIGVLILSKIKDIDHLKMTASLIWSMAGIYWFVTSWDVEPSTWFGIFIPILNSTGMAWMLLSMTGFYISANIRYKSLDNDFTPGINETISNIVAISSHLMIGGLLTFQIGDLWDKYTITFIDYGLTLSVTWGIYALLVFVWGAISKQKVFRWFGYIALVIVAAKTIFINLWESDTVAKIIVLFILGIIMFAISFINSLWKPEQKALAEKKDLMITTDEEIQY